MRKTPRTLAVLAALTLTGCANAPVTETVGDCGPAPETTTEACYVDVPAGEGTSYYLERAPRHPDAERDVAYAGETVYHGFFGTAYDVPAHR